MFIKVIAFGLMMDKEGYLRDIWNILDFFIIISGWIAYFLSNISGEQYDGGFNVIRSFRLLRPLMGLKMFTDLRKILLSIGRAMMAMKDISSVLLFALVMYAVIGLQVSVIILNLIRCGRDFCNIAA